MFSPASKLCVFAVMFLTCCATSTYKIHYHDDSLVGLVVSVDRLVMECEDVQDPEDRIDPDGRYGFMIHVLEDEGTKITFAQGNVIDRDWCFARLQAFEEMKKKYKIFFLAGMGEFNKTKEKIKQKTTVFPNGTKNDEWYWRGMSFNFIKSPDNFCITSYSGNKKPCPEDDMFPEAVHPF